MTDNHCNTFAVIVNLLWSDVKPPTCRDEQHTDRSGSHLLSLSLFVACVALENNFHKCNLTIVFSSGWCCKCFKWMDADANPDIICNIYIYKLSWYLMLLIWRFNILRNWRQHISFLHILIICMNSSVLNIAKLNMP